MDYYHEHVCLITGIAVYEKPKSEIHLSVHDIVAYSCWAFLLLSFSVSTHYLAICHSTVYIMLGLMCFQVSSTKAYAWCIINQAFVNDKTLFWRNTARELCAIAYF